MRVIHVASGREWRGGQNQVRLLANALRRRGNVRQVVVTGHGSELATHLANHGVPVATPAWHAALDPRALVAVVRETRREPAVIHAHDAHALVLARVAQWLTGARLVVTRRVDFHLRRPGLWARADRVIAISDAIRQVLLSDGLPTESICVVHSGIDPVEVRSAPPFGFRAKLGLAPNLPLAVNVAALVGHKNQATLVAAAVALRAQEPQLHWVIAGEGPLRPALERQIRASSIEDRVHLLGHVSNPLGLIREANVFVMSSKEEGLGTSVLDAMALEVPVVATRAGGIPEILEGGAGGLVGIGDAAALAAEVARVIADSAYAARFRETALRRLESFTDDRMAEGVEAVYRSVMLGVPNAARPATERNQYP